MTKDAVIALLAAVVMAECPVFGLHGDVKMAVIVGLSVILFIFLLFFEEMVEKYQRFKARRRKIRRKIEKLAELKVGEEDPAK